MTDEELWPLIQYLTEEHIEWMGGYPYDWAWIGDTFVVAALDDCKARQATILEVYTRAMLSKWLADARALVIADGCTLADAFEETCP